MDEQFVEACVAIPKHVQGNHSPISPTAGTFPKFVDGGKQASRLTDKYPNAYTDFYGSGTPCIFKTGPAWHNGPNAQGVVRESRPIYRHAIGPTWLTIGEKIYQSLDSIGVHWTSINPLAYADAGEAKPFCPFVVSIGVKPSSLLYDDAVAAAKVVQKILADAGFPTIEVAFVKSIVTHSGACSRLLSFNPLFNDVSELRKPFTNALGLSIAPLKHPHYEGTAALYYRLGQDNDRVAILTCAHVARPPPVNSNTTMTVKKKHAGQAVEEVVALGNGGYNNAVKAIMREIGDLVRFIEAWSEVLARLGDPVEEENELITEKCREHLELIEKANKRIEKVNGLHNEVTKHRTTLEQQVIGFVLHSEKIEVSVEPYKFTNDWALVELYRTVIDWQSFKGNKVYVGGNLSIAEFGNMMFSQVTDRKDYRYPPDGLLQAYGVVQAAEFRDPQHPDVHNEKCLLVMKNGSTTETTVGRVNGLESFTHRYGDYDINQISIKIAVCRYDKDHLKFSKAGDSGSIVLARDGRIVGLLTSGAASSDETDITYLTPYWWVKQQIKAKFPDCFLYDVVQ